MERLSIVLFIAWIATAQASMAQQQNSTAASVHQAPAQAAPGQITPGQTSPAVQPHYVVAGDIRNVNYFPWSPTVRLTIREAIMLAGPSDESVTVSVFRGTHDGPAWAEMISAKSPDSGGLVMNGDLLVVRAMEQNAVPGYPNAVIRTDSGVILTELKDENITVGDTLQQTVGLPSDDQKVRIMSRFHGPPVASAGLGQRVAHGDVILIARATRSTLRNLGNMAPAFSEWQQPAPASLPEANSGLGYVQPGSDRPQSDLMPLQFPGFSMMPTSDPAEPVVAESGYADQIDEVIVEDRLPVQAVSQADPLAGMAGTDLFESEVAPEAPSEVATALREGGSRTVQSMNIWNMLFIAGCLTAGLLVLFGSLRKADDVVTQQFLQKAMGTEPQILLNQDAAQIGASGEVPLEQHSRQMPESQASHSIIIDTQRLMEALKNPDEPVGVSVAQASPLVAASEWFGADWRQSSAITAGREVSRISKVAELETGNEIPHVTAPQIERAGSAFLLEKTVQESLAETARVVAGAAVLENASSELKSDTLPMDTLPPDFSELEDLIQNRLPVDLCSTQLPIRISLFGRAAGPRRLRLDAPHALVPGPHINIGAERKRVAPAAVAVSGVAIDQPSVDAPGSLDRALHSLQDRTNS